MGRSCLSVVTLTVQNPQNRQEQVQDIQVQADRRSDFLFRVVVADDQLRVDEDVSGEDECCYDSIAELDTAAVREEGGHEAEDDEHPEGTEEVGHPGCEVILGLAGEERKEDENSESED